MIQSHHIILTDVLTGKTKLTPNNNIHFRIPVPKGKHHIIIRYKDPYFPVGIYSAIVFLIFFVTIWTIRLKVS